MTTTTALEHQQQPEKDPMRFHLHYQKGKAGDLRTPAAAASWSASPRPWRAEWEPSGSYWCPQPVILAWVLANHVIHFLSNSWTGLLNGSGFKLPRPIHPAEACYGLLSRGVFHRRAGHHRPEGADEDGQGERAGGGHSSRRTRPVSGRPVAEEHRSHRTDPCPGRAADRPDRASPRGYLRALTLHFMTDATPAAAPLTSQRPAGRAHRARLPRCRVR